MNRVKRVLVAMLVAALVLPTAATAQEPQPLPEVRLTFDGRRPANPWAVFGSGLAETGREQSNGSGGRKSGVRAGGSLAGGPRLVGIEASPAVPAKSPLAAKRGAGQSQPLCCGPGTRTVIVVLVSIACFILVVMAEAAGAYQWPSGR
jgi:hypothetical protein